MKIFSGRTEFVIFTPHLCMHEVYVKTLGVVKGPLGTSHKNLKGIFLLRERLPGRNFAVNGFPSTCVLHWQYMFNC